VVLLNKGGFQIDLEIKKSTEMDNATTLYEIRAFYSNQLNTALQALTLQIAVPKTMRLRLLAQSAQVVPPFSEKSVMQDMIISVPAGVTAPIRMRYRVSYRVGDKTIEEQGEFNQFP
jgi:hypothetical protein